MNKNLKGIIAVGIVGIIGYFVYKKFAKKGIFKRTESIVDDNFELLKQKLGAGAKISSNDPNILVVFFDNRKYKAQYYKNGRIFIFDNTTNPPKQLRNGTYSMGGSQITLSNGKEIMDTSSAWGALSKTMK